MTLTIIKIKTFLRSLWFHVNAGLPKSSQEEINRRFNICVACEKYDSIKSQCKICGCNLSNKKIFLNKLAWADQKCPEGKW